MVESWYAIVWYRFHWLKIYHLYFYYLHHGSSCMVLLSLMITSTPTCPPPVCVAELPPEPSGAAAGNRLVQQQHRHTRPHWLWLWDGLHGASDLLLPCFHLLNQTALICKILPSEESIMLQLNLWTAQIQEENNSTVSSAAGKSAQVESGWSSKSITNFMWFVLYWIPAESEAAASYCFSTNLTSI